MYNLQYKHIKNLEANANPFIKIILHVLKEMCCC